MPFNKGESGNKAGKPRGSLNRTTIDLRLWINSFIEDNKDQIIEDWKSLEPKDRIQMFEKLLKYALPTLQATSLDLGFDNLTETQLDYIINQLIEKQNEG